MRYYLLLASALFCLSARADWPAFLGGDAREAVTSSAVPLSWSPEGPFAWVTDLPGHGQSSPVIHGNRVYLTAVEGEMKETNLVMAIDPSDGSTRWSKSFVSSTQVKNDVYTSRAAPTPVADDAGVYAWFESGNLIALTPSGEVRWQRDFVADYSAYEARFGLAASPVQTDDRLIIVADNDGPSYILAVDKATGETIWKTDRESRIAWSSPTLVEVDGRPQIVVSASGTIDGYDVESGKRLWTFDDVGGNTVATPLPAGDGSFLVGASPGRGGENTEGAKRSNMVMRITSTSDGYQPEVVWRNEKATSSFGSPIVHRGHAYYVNRAGVVFCIDAESGELAYNARIAESIWATPIGIDDRVYFFGKNGSTTVLATGPEEKELAVNDLWVKGEGDTRPGNFEAETLYGTAILDDGLLVRTGSRLFKLSTQ